MLLLDEPGLSLHASAQKDFMYLMKDMAKQNQIIFTTHSPYMLEEVRKVYSHLAEPEAMILTEVFWSRKSLRLRNSQSVNFFGLAALSSGGSILFAIIRRMERKPLL